MANGFEIEEIGGNTVITLKNDQGDTATHTVRGRVTDDQMIGIGFKMMRDFREMKKRGDPERLRRTDVAAKQIEGNGL